MLLKKKELLFKGIRVIISRGFFMLFPTRSNKPFNANMCSSRYSLVKRVTTDITGTAQCSQAHLIRPLLIRHFRLIRRGILKILSLTPYVKSAF